MASTIKKIRKLQRDPKMFIKDMVIKKFGGDPSANRKSKPCISFTPSEYEIVDGLIILSKPEIVAEFSRIKNSNSNTKMMFSWK